MHFESLKNNSTITIYISYFVSVFQEAAKKKVTEEEEKFIKEITDFNNEYEVTKKRELWIKENVKIEISDLENQTNILKRGMSI